MNDELELLINQIEAALLTARAIGARMTTHLLQMAILDIAAPGKLPGVAKMNRAWAAARRPRRPR